MSATFWNMRRRRAALAAKAAEKPVEEAAEKPVDAKAAEKPKKGKVKKDD